MNYQIEVVQNSGVVQKKNKRGGITPTVEIVYKKDGKVEARPFPDFANKAIWEQLLNLKAGDVTTVTAEKNDGGYWQWTTIGGASEVESGTAQTATQTASDGSPVPPRSQATTGKVLGSNYETPVERALRQRLIVAQSCLAQAVEYSKAINPKGVPADFDFEGTAERFYQWVFKTAASDFSDMKDDLPE